MSRGRASVVALVVVLGTSARANAQSIPDFLTARGIAVGGTRAFASGTESIFLNPAGLYLYRTYILEVDYGHDAAPVAGGTLTSGNGFVASIVDSKSNNYVATGFAYRYANLNVNGLPVQGSIYDLAVGTNIGNYVLFGIHASYFSYTNPAIVDVGAHNITGDVGAMVPISSFVLGVVGTNLISIGSADAPTGVSGSVAYTNRSSLGIGGDVRWQWWTNKTYISAAAGGEYMIAQMIPVRLGYMFDGYTPTVQISSNPVRFATQEGARYLTAGTGFYISSFGFDATYRHDIEHGTNSWIFAVKMFIGNGAN